MTVPLQRIAILLLVIGLAVLVPSVLTPPAERASLIGGFSIVLLIASTWLWWGLGAVLWRTHQAGPVLLDLGHVPQERPAHAAGAVLCAGAAGWALWTPYLHPRLLAVGYLSLAAHGVVQAVLATVRCAQLRSSGLSLPAEYIPWSRVGTYTVQPHGRRIQLVLRYRAWATTPGYPLEVAVSCRPEQWRRVEALLSEYVVMGGALR